MRNSSSSILSLDNTREVAAMIVLSKFPPMRTEFSQTSPAKSPAIITEMASSAPLILRKFWFGFDSIAFDRDIAERVRKMHVSEEAASKLYDMLQTSPAAAIAKARAEFVTPDNMREELDTAPVADFIRIDLTRAADIRQAITNGVPFQRLRDILLRASALTEQAEKAVMTEIRIAHAPRLSNQDAAVDRLLAL